MKPLIFFLMLFTWWSPHTRAELLMSPINLDIANNVDMTTLRIDNRSNKDAVLQIRVKHWDKENLKPTGIAISPPRIQISAGEYQMVRFVLTQQPNSRLEQQMYRVIVDELTPNNTKLPNGLSVSMRYQLPLSVGGDDLIPARVKNISSLKQNWTSGLQFKRIQNSQLLVKNINNGYARLSKVILVNSETNTQYPAFPGLLGYVLSGATEQFDLTRFNQIEFDRVYLEVNGVRISYPVVQ